MRALSFDAILDGHVEDSELAAYLIESNDRGVTVDEIVAAAEALRRRGIGISAPPGSIDVCGTGGDHAGTLNISTAVALMAAACGVPVAKHGNRAASSRSGAADVLEALGIDIAVPPATAEARLHEIGITFLMAPQYHPALARVAAVRKAIGKRTIFNMLGPLVNPAGVARQLVGVYSPDILNPMAEALLRLGTEHAWVVHGGGLDELTIAGSSEIAALKNGTITRFSLDPADYGLETAPLSAIRGGSPMENGQALLGLLNGAPGAYRSVSVLNTAAALLVAGTVDHIDSGIELAAQAIDRGAAAGVLVKLREYGR